MKKATTGIILALIMTFTFTACVEGAPMETLELDSSEVAVQQEASSSNVDEGTSEEPSELMQEEPIVTELVMYIDGTPIKVVWEDNDSVSALKELAKDTPIEIQMSMYGGFEQVGQLGADLPRTDAQITTKAGDVVLYQGNQIVVFYGSNSWAYTRLGHIEEKTPEELAQLLGKQDVTITLEIK